MAAPPRVPASREAPYIPGGAQMGKLKIGIDLHNRASVFMPQQGLDYDLNRLIDLAVLCEELGFYSVSVGDSLIAKPRWRTVPTLAAIAARTSRITVMSHI